MFVLVKQTINYGKMYVVCITAAPTRLFHFILVLYFTRILISEERNTTLVHITGSNLYSEGYRLHCGYISRLSRVKCFVVQAHCRSWPLAASLIYPICFPYLQNGPRKSIREGMSSIPAAAYNSD